MPNTPLIMGGLNPKELKVALEGIAHEYSEGDWALEYIAVLESKLEQTERFAESAIQNILRDPFPQSIYPQLSQLERNIAKMTVIDGMTAQEIADALGSSVSTVNSYRRMVYKAFGIRTHRWPSLVFDRIREVLKDG